MPFYTFVCNSCKEKFEVRCTMVEKDSGSVTCPACGANELDRIFEGFSVAVGGAGSCPAGGCPMKKGTHQCSGGCCS